MDKRRALTGWLMVAFVVLGVAALWLPSDQPEVDGSLSGNFTCRAPWDTVLNDSDNMPGGDPRPDDKEIAAECRSAGERHFYAGVASGVGSGLALIAALGLTFGRRRSLTGSRYALRAQAVNATLRLVLVMVS